MSTFCEMFELHISISGTCFTCLAEDMKNVYAPYCRNHDDVITLIEKVLNIHLPFALMEKSTVFLWLKDSNFSLP